MIFYQRDVSGWRCRYIYEYQKKYFSKHLDFKALTLEEKLWIENELKVKGPSYSRFAQKMSEINVSKSTVDAYIKECRKNLNDFVSKSTWLIGSLLFANAEHDVWVKKNTIVWAKSSIYRTRRCGIHDAWDR